jgi:DUF971 family protein
MIPTDVKLHQVSGVLELCYEDGTQYKLPAEYLRVYSPSAEVQGHSADQAVLQHGKGAAAASSQRAARGVVS